MHACYQQLGYSVCKEICRLQCTSRIYLAGCISEYINEGPLVFSKFHVTYYLTPSFLVLFLKREICLLLWIKSYLQKLKKMKNKNEPVWLIKSPKCKFNLYHALFFSAGHVTNPTRCAMHIAIFFVIRLKNSRSTISIPMNKNLFPSDFFFQVSLNVFLHCCVQWDFFSTCIFDQDMTLLPTITQPLMPWLSPKRNPYSGCPLWTFLGVNYWWTSR